METAKNNAKNQLRKRGFHARDDNSYEMVLRRTRNSRKDVQVLAVIYGARVTFWTNTSPMGSYPFDECERGIQRALEKARAETHMPRAVARSLALAPHQ